MDPAVAAGGRLVPTRFAGRGSGRHAPAPAAAAAAAPTRPSSQRHKKAASLAIMQSGSRSTATLISAGTCGGNSPAKGRITGYSLHGRRGKEPGGDPDFVLSGHLADVTCLVTVDGTWDNLKVGGGNAPATGHVKFLTGGRDGMVLVWGRSTPSLGEETANLRSGKSHEWQRRFRGGHGGISNNPRSVREEPPFRDTDRW